MITREQAQEAMAARREVAYLAGTPRVEHGIITEVSPTHARVLYLGDRDAKLTALDALDLVTLEVAAVVPDFPDSVTHYRCAARAAGDNSTHELAPSTRQGVTVQRCKYCGWPEATLRQMHGLTEKNRTV